LNGTNLILPYVPAWAEPVWHLYVVQHRQRDALQQSMAADDVDTLIHYPTPPHRQQAYAKLGMALGTYPLAEQLANCALSLPIGPTISESEIDSVIQSCHKFKGAA
jgi:dTDP-4-amino-4,6-dideoxygalactose transaminase